MVNDNFLESIYFAILDSSDSVDVWAELTDNLKVVKRHICYFYCYKVI